MAEYYDRLIERKIENKMKSSGAVAVEGPKFCGKTTTALRYAKSDIRLNTRQRIELARLQPKNVLKGDVPRVIDEWQTVPDIWNEVKAWIDENPDFGQFILTGSSTPADKSDIYVTIEVKCTYAKGEGYVVGTQQIAVGTPLALRFNDFFGKGYCVSIEQVK